MKQQPAVFLKLLVLLVPREMKVKHSISRMVSAFAPPKLVICHRRGHGHSFSSASSARSPKSSLCLAGCASTYLTTTRTNWPTVASAGMQKQMPRSTASTDRLRSQGSRRLRPRPRCYGVSVLALRRPSAAPAVAIRTTRSAATIGRLVIIALASSE